MSENETKANALTPRDRLRAKTLGAKKVFKKELIKFDGETFEIRQPTLRERSEVRKKCTSVTEDGVEFNMFEFLIWAVIGHTFVPGTDDKLFSEEDYDELSDIPAGGWFDKFAENASELCNVNTEDEKKDSSKTAKVTLSM